MSKTISLNDSDATDLMAYLEQTRHLWRDSIKQTEQMASELKADGLPMYRNAAKNAEVMRRLDAAVGRTLEALKAIPQRSKDDNFVR